MPGTEEKPTGSVTPKIELTLLIKLIPEYDGSFKKLTDFIDNVSEAYKLAKDEQKEILMPFIKAALKGAAQSIVQTSSFNTWEPLKRKLIETFGERKSFAQV